MKYYIQILSSQSALSTPSLFMFFDSSRYIFNSGDCVQRIANEHKIRLSKMKNVFITSINPNTVGSLPGMMLSLIESQPDAKRTIHGPPGLLQFIKAACTFTWHGNFNIVEYGNSDFIEGPLTSTTTHVFSDDNMKVHIIPLADYVSLPNSSDSPYGLVENTGCVYIIECKPFPNKFLIDKAKALGVPRGPLLGKLSSGQSVVVGDRVITPEEVTEKGPAQPVVVIFDLPNTQRCAQIVERLQTYLQPQYNLASFLHFTRKEVVLSTEYIEMIMAFPKASNTILDLQMSPVNSLFKKSDELLIKLNKLLPQAFPLPNFPKNLDMNILEVIHNLIPNCIIPNFFTKIVLAPANSQGIDRSEEIKPIDTQKLSIQLNSISSSNLEILTSSNDTIIPNPSTSSGWCSHSCSYQDIVDINLPGSDPQLLFLGTASMKPGAYRNVSGIHFSEWGGGLLLDCGEGSYSQLVRSYGEGISQVLLDLKAILITHLHADHDLGIIKVLYERAKLTTEPLIVVAPSLFDIYLSNCASLMGPFYYEFQTPMMINVPGLEIFSVPVDHRIEAYGFIISHKSGWKLVYSGDTRPCPGLIQGGYNATVLIHEATFDDLKQKDAVEKFHSTLGEALQVASAMEVWKVVLTHFSQRYSKLPENTKVDAIYTFDLMRFRFSECNELVKLMPMLIQEWKDEDLAED